MHSQGIDRLVVLLSLGFPHHIREPSRQRARSAASSRLGGRKGKASLKKTLHRVRFMALAAAIVCTIITFFSRVDTSPHTQHLLVAPQHPV